MPTSELDPHITDMVQGHALVKKLNASIQAVFQQNADMERDIKLLMIQGGGNQPVKEVVPDPVSMQELQTVQFEVKKMTNKLKQHEVQIQFASKTAKEAHQRMDEYHEEDPNQLQKPSRKGSAR